MTMETVLGVMIGLGLAAACGFRVFVPMLVLSVAAKAGAVHLGSGFSWIASDGALAAFATASLLEVLGYWVPWIDHALDVAASPAAIVAGTLVAGSQLADLGPMLQWTCAIIAGGGIAAAVQATSVTTRAASTISTAGLGNPIISTVHSAGSVVLSLLAVVAPFLGAACVALILAAIGFSAWRWRRRRSMSGSYAEGEAVCVPS